MKLLKVRIKMHDTDPTLRELGLGDETQFRFEDSYINPQLITSIYTDIDESGCTCVNMGGDGVVIEEDIETFLERVA